MALFGFKDLADIARPDFSSAKAIGLGALFGPPTIKTFKAFTADNKIPDNLLGLTESKTSVVDSLTPRSVCYGYGAWQASLAWRQSHQYGVDSEEPKEALTDVLIFGDHPFEDLGSGYLWVETDRLSIGSDASGSGNFWVPADSAAINPGGTPTSTSYVDGLVSGGWFVPNANLDETNYDWQRVRNSDGKRVPILAFQVWDGTQTTELRTDPWLSAIPGWDDVNRDALGMGAIAVTWCFTVTERVKPGGILPLLMEGYGKNTIYDWRTETTGYTNNAVLCFADALMWEYFPWQRVDEDWAHVRLLPSHFHTGAMQSAADLCDETSTSFTGKRYTVSYQIGSETDPEEIFDDFSMAMGGMTVTMIDDKIAIIPGGPRSWVAGFDMGDLDKSGSVTTPTHRDRQSRFNTVIGSYRRVVAGWDYDDTSEVTASAYRDDDQGRIRTKRLRLPAIGGSGAKGRAERLCKIALDRHRLEDTVYLTVHGLMGVDTLGNKAAALRVREGDIVRLTYDTKGWVDKEFEVVLREWNRDYFAMRFELAEWSQDIDWDGTGIVADEALESPLLFKGGLEDITGLTASIVSGSGAVQTDGSLWVEVEVDWDDHPYLSELLGGSYRITWQTAAMSKRASSSSDTSRKRLLLQANVSHTIQVRAELRSATSDYASISYTPSAVGLGQPPSDPSLGGSLHSDPYFDRMVTGTVAASGGAWVDSSSGGTA